jgi:hypothetical protein
VRHWVVVVVLAWVLAALVSSSLDRAAATQDRWGRTTLVWVAAHPLRPGDPLRDAVRARRWPAGLVPAAVARRPTADQRAATPIDAGTVLSDAMVARARTDRRAVAVPLPDAHLPVDPDDRVDVWATAADAPDGVPRTRRVAVDARVVRRSDGAVVLAVAPSEVPGVSEAAATATVSLVGVG